MAAAHTCQRALRLPFSRLLAPADQRHTDGESERELSGIIDDAAHCPAYFQLLVKALVLPGLQELEHTAVLHVVLCEQDRVPPSRFSRHFTDSLPAGHRSPCSTASVTFRCSRSALLSFLITFIEECCLRMSGPVWREQTQRPFRHEIKRF